MLEPELPDGNIEYKSKLVKLTPTRIQELMTQLAYRISEGNGEALYEIGVADDGQLLGLSDEELNISLENLKKITKNLKASIVFTSVKKIDKKNPESLKIAEVLIRENQDVNNRYIDLFVATIGNVDAGKTSLIGVLTKGILDNGRGKSRSMILQYKHEIETGRTSTITHHVMGFDENGKTVNDKAIKNHLTSRDIVMDSKKVITFADLCGHEKYLRTTIYGMSSVLPDYAMILIGANMGLTNMTKEHMAICLSLKIPIIIVLTKIDIAPVNKLAETLSTITRLLKLPGVRKVPYLVRKHDDIALVAKNVPHDNIVPIFQISNVTGEGIENLKTFYNLVPSRLNFQDHNKSPVEYLIDGNYYITGIGTVVSGFLNSGTVKVNDQVLLGPTFNGEFLKTYIRSIHYKQISVSEAKAGHYVCFALKRITRNQIRKGMVIITEDNSHRSVWKFSAEISIIHSHHTSIKKKYQPYLHIGNVRQSARILSIENIKTKVEIDEENPTLRAGDKALVKFEFVYRPEYIRPNMKLIFREGRIRGIGLVTKIGNDI